MSLNTYFLGRRIYLGGGIQVTGFAFPKIYFKVQEKYEIFFNIELFKFSDCCCVHGSFWGINDENKCKHVQACREWIKDNLQSFINSHSSEEVKWVDLTSASSQDSCEDVVAVNPVSSLQDISLREQSATDSINHPKSFVVSIPRRLSETLGNTSELAPTGSEDLLSSDFERDILLDDVVCDHKGCINRAVFLSETDGCWCEEHNIFKDVTDPMQSASEYNKTYNYDSDRSV